MNTGEGSGIKCDDSVVDYLKEQRNRRMKGLEYKRTENGRKKLTEKGDIVREVSKI